MEPLANVVMQKRIRVPDRGHINVDVIHELFVIELAMQSPLDAVVAIMQGTT